MPAVAVRALGLGVGVAIFAGAYFGWNPALRLFRGAWLNDLRIVIAVIAIILALSALDWLWAKLFRKD